MARIIYDTSHALSLKMRVYTYPVLLALLLGKNTLNRLKLFWEKSEVSVERSTVFNVIENLAEHGIYRLL